MDFYGRRFVGSNLQNPNFAELARAMGAEGLRVEHADQVGDALRAACKAQSEGKTTVLEMMVSQELGDPFRRDALKQPVRFLQKYQPYVNQPFASGKRRCRSSRRDTRHWARGRARAGAGSGSTDAVLRIRERGSGAAATSGRRRAGSMPARRVAAPAGARKMASDGLFAPLRDAGLSAGRLRTAVAYPLSASSLGAAFERAAGYIEPVLVARASRGCWRNRACRPAGWKSSTRLTTSWNRRGRALARDGAVGMLMKGSLHSDHFMAAVVARESACARRGASAMPS